MKIRNSLVRNLLWGIAAVALVWIAYSFRTGVSIRPAADAPRAEGLVLVDTLGDPVSLESIFGQFPTLTELTEYAVDKALEAANNNQSAAAKALGISKQALSKRLKKRSRLAGQPRLTGSTEVDRPG